MASKLYIDEVVASNTSTGISFSGNAVFSKVITDEIAASNTSTGIVFSDFSKNEPPYIQTTKTLDGTSSTLANASAYAIRKDVLAAGGTVSDVEALEGPLWLNPARFTGSNLGAESFQVWCDMTTQGGGWTLAIKYDDNYSVLGSATKESSGVCSLQRFGGTSYYRNTGLADLDSLSYLYSCLDVRDIIKYNKKWTYGGKYMMHATTSVTSNANSSSYIGHNFTASVSGSDVSVTGGTTTSFSPMFSSFFERHRVDPSNLWNTYTTWVTDDDGATELTSIGHDTHNSTEISNYGGGWFYAVGTNPDSPIEAIDSNSAGDTHQNSTYHYVLAPFEYDGESGFSVQTRNGSVYCSGAGANRTLITGHGSPKVNWSWYSKDGTQMNYGYGSYAIGTPCGSGSRPRHRMNYMFVR